MSQPIACSLTPTQAEERVEQTAALARHALRRREPIADGQRLHFEDNREIEAELRHVIAAEAECCLFLELRLRRVDEGLELDITGPAEARPVIEGLFT